MEELLGKQHDTDGKSYEQELKEVALGLMTSTHFDAIDKVDSESVQSDMSVDVFDLGFSRIKTTMVLRIVFFFSIMMNVDHGAVPSGIKQMQDDLVLQTVQMGNFGSLVFFGLAVGSVCATLIVSFFTWK